MRLLPGLCLLSWLLAAAGPVASQAPDLAPWVKDDEPGQLPPPALLAVGVVEFDPGLGPKPVTDPRFALRGAESRYVAFLLRRVLEETERWGPVRMLPGPDHAVELLIQGTIVESGGDRLELHLIATDSTGRRWIDRPYQATAQLADYRSADGADPFRSLYSAVAADLERFRSTLSLQQLEQVIETARLKYAAELAPAAYRDYIALGADGRVQIRRLPAAGDPMLARIERVREAEYLFIDTVDLRFARYFEDVRPTYMAWRSSTLESKVLMNAYRREAESRRGRQSARQRYYQLRELKLHQQTLREALGGFALEAGPTSLELNGELVELSGSLTEQFDQWKSLLARIHAAEVGLPPG